MQKNKPKIWTKKGLTELGSLIRQCREAQAMSLVECAAFIKEQTGESIPFRTLSSVETASNEPRHNTLAIIAAAGFVKKGDRVLDIHDFIDIASETWAISSIKEKTMMHPLHKLITDHLERNNLSLEQFSRICHVPVSDLEAIMRGESTKEFQADIGCVAGFIKNPATGVTFQNYRELLDYCGMTKNPSTGTWEVKHVVNNGRY